MPSRQLDSAAPNMRYGTWIAVGLVAVCVTIYGRTIYHDFVNYDDPAYITQHHLVKQGLTSEGFRAAFTTPHSYNWHPLTTLSHMLDCQLFGSESAAGHHAVNLVLHAASAVVLFLALRWMTGSLWPSALVAALFAVHPLGVESVAWISERKNVLSTLLWFATLAAYSHYVRKATLGRYLLVVATLALGMMSKQMLVTVPCTLLLLDYWPLRRMQFGQEPPSEPPPAVASRSWLVIEKLPLLAVSFIGSAMVLWAQGNTQLTLDTLPLVPRIENALITYVAYLGKLVWPADLIVYYPLRAADLPPAEMAKALFPAAAMSGGVLLAISAACIWQWRKRPYLIVGWLWYLGTLVPVIGIVQVGHQSMADRYTYVPLVGIYMMFAWSAAEFVERRESARIWVAGVAVAVLMVLSVVTFNQVGHWRDTKTLFTHVLSVNDDNSVAHHSIAESLYKEQRFDEALYHIKRAIELRPSEPRPYLSLGYVYYRQRKFGPALESYNRGIAIRPDLPFALNGRALVYLALGDFAKALADVQRALELDPHNQDARHFKELMLGKIALRDGDLPAAQSHFRLATTIDDQEDTTWVFLGMIAASQGRTSEAILAYREALARAPNSIEANVNLANLLITAPDHALRNATEAVQLAENVCRLTQYTRPDLLNTLAAAYYAAGRTNDAIQVVQRALGLPDIPPELRQQLMQNLDLFQTSPETSKP